MKMLRLLLVEFSFVLCSAMRVERGFYIAVKDGEWHKIERRV
ncbi:hypothetical protein GLYMA_14G010550v4 [Glycine max]|nr:hypothetical protein GLYMA_14G010550v4 [Glycine max]KAH1092580.1 hypothetical protein GYH30_038679 [Glycine max]